MHQTQAKDAHREIVKGVVITSLIFIVCAYLPVLGILFSVFLPLPILFYRVKLGRKPAGLVIAGTTLFIFFVNGKAYFDLFYFAQLMMLGFALGETFRRGLSVEKTVLYACFAFWAATAAGLLFFGASSGTGVFSMAEAFVDKNLELSIAYYKEVGAPPEQIQAIRNSMDKIRYFMLGIIPGAVAAATLFTAWCNLLLAKTVFAAVGLAYPNFGPLGSWSAPEPLVWVVIGSGIMLLVPEKNILLLGLNGFLVLTTIYFFQGIAIISFFFEKKDFPPLLRYIFYGFIGMQLMMVWLVSGVGFFDMWFNFRKLEK